MTIASLASKNDQPQQLSKIMGCLIFLGNGNVEIFTQSFPNLKIDTSEYSDITYMRPNTKYGAKAISRFYLSNFMRPIQDAINKGKACEWISKRFSNETNHSLFHKARAWMINHTKDGGNGGNGVYVVTGYSLIKDPHLSTASSTTNHTTFEVPGDHLYSLQIYKILRRDGKFCLSKTPNEINNHWVRNVERFMNQDEIYYCA
jgi:hypothetical protein